MRIVALYRIPIADVCRAYSRLIGGGATIPLGRVQQAILWCFSTGYKS
jgi:hypothetical protein